MKQKLHITLKYVVGVGTLAYGAISAAQPQRFAQLTGMEEDEIRRLALRDLGSGLEILTAESSAPALVSRAFYDFKDAAGLMRRKPPLALFAAVWGLLALAVLATRSAAHDTETTDG
jgi:hypothetical protein